MGPAVGGAQGVQPRPGATRRREAGGHSAASWCPCFDPDLVFRYQDGEVELLARMEHERWVQEKRDQGFVHGPLRENMAHPDIVPWEKLSRAEQDKDAQFIRDLPRILDDAGFQILRLPNLRRKVPIEDPRAGVRNGSAEHVSPSSQLTQKSTPDPKGWPEAPQHPRQDRGVLEGGTKSPLARLSWCCHPREPRRGWPAPRAGRGPRGRSGRRRGRLVDRLAQLQVVDDRGRPQVEVLAHQAEQLVLGDAAGGRTSRPRSTSAARAPIA